MKAWKKNKKTTKTENNSRINLMMAIIFVLSGAVIAKLYYLQVINYEKYMGLALRQQQTSSKIEPVRGRIYIEDNKNGLQNGELFPLATNKQFANVFAKPNLIKDPAATAEVLYGLFNQAKVESEIDRLIMEDETIKEESEEFKKIKKEIEVKNRKEKIIGEYVTVLSKKDDPYEPLAKRVDEDTITKLKELKIEGIDFYSESGRYYPEKNTASHLIGFVGYSGNTKEGRYGLEGFFDRELTGHGGSVVADKNARGELSLIDEQNYIKPEDGSDLFLTINRSIQFEACQKLKASVLKHGADGGSVVVMEPKTGSIIAMCAYPDYDPNDYKNVDDVGVYNNPVIFSQYEPGSTFKAITMAAALDQGKVQPQTTYQDKGMVMVEGWPKPIKNSDYESAGGHGLTTMNTVLEKSLNTGVIYAMEKTGPAIFADYVKKFGFGEKTGIELETESNGNISNITAKKIRPVNAATASFGQGITATPMQMITAYGALANGGILMKPFVVKQIITPSGQKSITSPKEVRRVISQRSASLLTAMLVNAVENGHAERAKVPGYYVAGKTGTAQVASSKTKGYEKGNTIQTFIGYSPANDPKFVMLTRLDNPKDSRFAESSAVPLFGEIAKFILNYYQVPLERKIN